MLHYVSGVFDNAVYPGLMMQYVTSNGGVNITESFRYTCICVFTAIMTYLTWRGLDVNGTTCIVLTAFVLLPFIVFSCIGIPQIDPSNWLLAPVKHNGDGDDDLDYDDDNIDKFLRHGGLADIDWRTLLNCLFWNLNYYDSASAFSGDCVEPAKTFPKGERVNLFCLFFVWYVVCSSMVVLS